MRPIGTIRLMTRQALADLVHERRLEPTPGATWRDVADRLRSLGVAPRAVVFTLKNMARAGAVMPVGDVRLADSSRPLIAYAPVPQAPPAAVYLDLVARAWVSKRGGVAREPDG